MANLPEKIIALKPEIEIQYISMIVRKINKIIDYLKENKGAER